MSADAGSSRLSSALWCGFYGLGIIGALCIYGLLQERIMTVPYGGELFKISVFLVFCNRLAAVVFAFAMITIKGESYVNTAPFWKYLAVSLSNVYASACQYEALKYVSFPVQMLGKSFKMMPVMVWGMLISKKSYGVSDWLIAAAVTGGVTEFLMTGQIDSESNAGSSVYGLGLLGCFLLLDGFTSTFQEKLFKEYKTTKYNQMLYVNLGSVAVSTITLVLTGGVGDALGFCAAHPEFVRDATALSAAAVTGQWFIYSQVKEFGALVFAATMNVRQVNSILLSYATYGHSITILQVGGLATVFAALFYKSYVGLSADNSEKTPLVPKLDDPQEVKTLKSKDQA
jgi:adenosine 3'-phospho 5'-phosphosulfate transporter B2